MRKLIFTALCLTAGISLSFAQSAPKASVQPSTVYMTKEITPKALVKIYNALGRPASGKVAVKISTGEPGGHNYLKPELIGDLVKKLNGTIVECNTAYQGKRFSTADHLQAAKDHGFTAIAPVVIMDAEGQVNIPVKDTTHIKYDIVGKKMLDFDYMVNLAHFKGHAMGGFGGVLKNQSIGIASADGKTYIHTAGKTDNTNEIWKNIAQQDDFLESMAAAAQGVADHFGEKIIYINVMNNMSIDCDCDAHPKDPTVKDIGILASTDPVALDKACVDLIYQIVPVSDNDPRALIERIEQKHGIHTVEHAEKIGLGTTNYKIVSLD